MQHKHSLNSVVHPYNQTVTACRISSGSKLKSFKCSKRTCYNRLPRRCLKSVAVCKIDSWYAKFTQLSTVYTHEY